MTDVREALNEHFGIEREVVEHLLAVRSAAAVFPTGSNRTGATGRNGAAQVCTFHLACSDHPLEQTPLCVPQGGQYDIDSTRRLPP
jgi:hypothetical protein